MKAIVNGKIILKDQVLLNKVLLFDDRISSIEDSIELGQDVEMIDAEGRYVSPGFIDIHIHGAFGYDAMDWNRETISNISRGLCQFGVTGFLPTTMSMDTESIKRTLDNIADSMNSAGYGAQVLGAHLEGPFISKSKKGAHDEQYITKADYMLIEEYLRVIKLITIAPEVDGNMSFIKDMCQHPHISLSMGHSNATYEEAMEAIDAGIRSTTHMFNAMSSLNHREPGVVGAVLNSDIYCELIADKIHVHPAMYKLLINAKGKDKVILITDAIRAACMKPGVYDLGGQKATVTHGEARLEDGTLAGSVLRLNEAVRNFRAHTNLPINDVIAMVTANPAKLIGLEREIGSIEEGKKADLVVFDEGMEIFATIIKGNIVYRNYINHTKVFT